MAGTTTWTGGANDGNWATAGNWSTSGGSTPPAAGDAVIINATGQNITAGLAIGNVAFASLTITKGFTGSIGGGSAGSLSWAGATCAAVTISMGGDWIYLGAGTRTLTKVVDTGRGTIFFTDGTDATLQAGLNTNLDLGAANTVTAFSQAGGVCKAAAGTVFTTATIGGTLTTSRGATTLNVEQSGSVIAKDAGAFAAINNRGSINYRGSGTITAMTNFPTATFNVIGNVFGFTITNSTRYAGASVNYDGSGVTVTQTNTETKIGFN